MTINPYALARFGMTGCLVLSFLALFIDPQPAWFSATLGWGVCCWYESMRRRLFQILIQLKNDGLLTVEDDDVPPRY